ncbi:hypothetical protein BS78_K303900 [Paspalum vaginatum]|uniref:Uncharacterized protein n=1 Tax=Paspalum vaginatum TaxID=158149 RepID=A0A9W7XD81_9POAL|nr:hypothetical protein BS78_K303900 [Paspalum vaginatum]
MDRFKEPLATTSLDLVPTSSTNWRFVLCQSLLLFIVVRVKLPRIRRGGGRIGTRLWYCSTCSLRRAPRLPRPVLHSGHPELAGRSALARPYRVFPTTRAAPTLP